MQNEIMPKALYFLHAPPPQSPQHPPPSRTVESVFQKKVNPYDSSDGELTREGFAFRMHCCRSAVW